MMTPCPSSDQDTLEHSSEMVSPREAVLGSTPFRFLVVTLVKFPVVSDPQYPHPKIGIALKPPSLNCDG